MNKKKKTKSITKQMRQDKNEIETHTIHLRRIDWSLFFLYFVIFFFGNFFVNAEKIAKIDYGVQPVNA